MHRVALPRRPSAIGLVPAMVLAMGKLKSLNKLAGPPLRGMVAATSVGLLGGVPCLDLSYAEDSQADVDMNVVRTDSGRYVEVQGTGEKTPFSPDEMKAMLDLANHGAIQLFEQQRKTLREVLPALLPRP